MRNADRLLGVIYRECRLDKLLRETDGFSLGNRCGEMTIKNDRFLRTVAADYTRKYPQNYSLEEVENTLKVYLRYGESYLNGDDNACGLFFYCAEQLFLPKNGTMVVKFDALLEWDGFCNKIDANIPIAAFAALHPSIDLTTTEAVVRHDNRTLSKILGKGAADNHMHLKASGYSAAMSWAAFISCSFSEESSLLEFISKTRMVEQGFAIDSSSALLILKKIKLIRLYLEARLSPSRACSAEGNGHSYGSAMPTPRQMERYLASENDIWCYTKRAWLDYVLDRVANRYHKGNGVRNYVFAERLFLREVFLKIQSDRDKFFLHLFNIYLAALSQIRFYLVQDNEGMGFKKFKLREDVKSDFLSLRTNSMATLVRADDVYLSVFDRCYRSKIVKQAEFRIAPNNDVGYISLFQKLKLANNTASRSNKASKKIRYGIIVHFIKAEKPTCPSKGAYRWEDLRERYEKDTLQLLNYLTKGKRYSKKIVGIDAANYEAQCRPEVLASCFRRIRQMVGSERELGVTFHVGEAFDALCSGLRAIDEAVRFMDLRRGDRLGHALALGIDVEAFQKAKRNMVSLSLQDHVDNLAWLYHIISHSGTDSDKRCLGYLHEEFHRNCSRLYDGIVLHAPHNGVVLGIPHISDYIDAWKLRGDDPKLYGNAAHLKIFTDNYNAFAFGKDHMLNRSDLEHRSAFENSKARLLYYYYLFSVKQYRNGEQLINLYLEQDYWQAVKAAQRLLREKVYELELAIETNPSSNRKISYVRHFMELPLLTFNRHHLHGIGRETENDLPVSINTDDCDIFQTDLANEYALVVAALQREGLDRQEIYDYIDYLRASSLLQAFPLP